MSRTFIILLLLAITFFLILSLIGFWKQRSKGGGGGGGNTNYNHLLQADLRKGRGKNFLNPESPTILNSVQKSTAAKAAHPNKYFICSLVLFQHLNNASAGTRQPYLNVLQNL